MITTDGVWFGARDRPQFGWLTRPASGIGASGIVLAPPTGYAYWSSHRTLRTLAERLGAAGHAVLRIDYDGTGDSAGDQWDPDRVHAWRETVRLAAAQLRRNGATRIALVGAKLGATIALLEAGPVGADRVVAWLPVLSGRRHARELRLLATPVPEDSDPLAAKGTLVFAGSVFSAQTMTDLSSLAVTDLDEFTGTDVLVIDDPSGSTSSVVDHLRSIGSEVRHVRLGGAERALDIAPEFATVPEEIVAAACEWLGDATEQRCAAPPPRPAASPNFRWRGGRVQERVIKLPDRGHVGLLTEPAEQAPGSTTLVFLNPGSETHVGPGRAWVEYARDLALLGHRSIRLDFLGWGESPDAGRAPGRPYDSCCVQDTVAIVRELHEAGHARVVLCGLCASAWIALQAALCAPVAGVVAMNPQMYWKPGDPVEIDWDLIRSRRSTEIRRIEFGARAHAWSMLDALGYRPRAGRWLDQLAATGIPVRLLFAEGDDGLIFLNGRLQRRLQRVCRHAPITVQELPEVDHPMHLTWLRPRVLRALHQTLQQFEGVAGAASRPEPG